MKPKHLITAAAAMIPLAAAAAEKPNVILIIIDDQGFGGVGCYPHNVDVSTPNIDALARNGVQFMHGYTSGFLSAPTRSGILTGRYQETFGFYGLSDPPAGGIPTDIPIMSQRLKEVGYRSAAIGKWHVGDNLPNNPLNRGFDYFYGFIDGAHDYFNPIQGGSWDGWYDGLAFTLENNEPVVDMKYATYEYTDRAVDFIKKEDDRPFFLYFAPNAVHSPLEAPQDIIDKVAKNPAKPTKEELLIAMTLTVDNSVAQLEQALDEKGIRDNTLIFYISDNGAPQQNFDWDLRGKKGSYYEGGIRVPFIMSWPAAIKTPGIKYDPSVISFDATATIYAATGVSTDDCDGTDLLPYVNGKKKGDPHEVLFWSIEKEHEAPQKNCFAVRKGKWKLVSDPKIEHDFGLYDLENDPLEKNDLKDTEPQIAKEMYSLYLDWICKCPEAILHNGHSRLDGKSQMKKYQQKYKEKYGVVPSVRPVITNEPDASKARFEERQKTGN